MTTDLSIWALKELGIISFYDKTDKTDIMANAPSIDSDQPGHPARWSKPLMSFKAVRL